MLRLSKKWAETLSKLPETGMDYQIATVVLKDGRQFPQTAIVGGLIAQIRGLSDIPFSEGDIADFIITHDKWDWSHEYRQQR
jgi:hypothetical protein